MRRCWTWPLLAATSLALTLSSCEWLIIIFLAPISGVVATVPGAEATTVLQLRLEPSCYVPDAVTYECSSEVTMELRGARQGAGYADLPEGLEYTFSPASLVVETDQPVVIGLTLDVPETLAPGTYELTAIARLTDEEVYATAIVPLTVGGDGGGFSVDVENTDLVLNEFGYVTTHVIIERDPGFTDEVTLELVADGEVLDNLDFFFAADDEPDVQLLAIQDVSLPSGEYPLFVVGTSGELSDTVPISLTVP